MPEWKENAEQGIQGLKEIERGIAAFTEAFMERADEYRRAMSALDEKVAAIETAVRNGVERIDARAKSIAEAAEAFERTREAAEQLQEQSIAAKGELEKAVQAATENYNGIADVLVSIKSAYGAAIRLKEEALPEIRNAADAIAHAHSRGGAAAEAGGAGEGGISKLRMEVAELKVAVSNLSALIKLKMGDEDVRHDVMEANREIAERFGDSCKALLELVSDKYSPSGNGAQG